MATFIKQRYKGSRCSRDEVTVVHVAQVGSCGSLEQKLQTWMTVAESYYSTNIANVYKAIHRIRQGFVVPFVFHAPKKVVSIQSANKPNMGHKKQYNGFICREKLMGKFDNAVCKF